MSAETGKRGGRCKEKTGRHGGYYEIGEIRPAFSISDNMFETGSHSHGDVHAHTLTLLIPIEKCGMGTTAWRQP